MAEDSLWRELDTQNPEDVLVRMRQGVYGKVNDDTVGRWLVERPRSRQRRQGLGPRGPHQVDHSDPAEQLKGRA